MTNYRKEPNFGVAIENMGHNGRMYTIQRYHISLQYYIGWSVLLVSISCMIFNIYACIIIISFIIITWIIWYMFQMKKEIICIQPEVGIELIHVWNRFKIEKEFLMWNDIETIIINEGFRCCYVHYYLAFMPVNQELLFLPFKQFIPKLKTLLPIYKDIKQIFIQYGKIN